MSCILVRETRASKHTTLRVGREQHQNVVERLWVRYNGGASEIPGIAPFNTAACYDKDSPFFTSFTTFSSKLFSFTTRGALQVRTNYPAPSWCCTIYSLYALATGVFIGVGLQTFSTTVSRRGMERSFSSEQTSPKK